MLHRRNFENYGLGSLLSSDPTFPLTPDVFAVPTPPRAADNPSWRTIVPDALRGIDFELEYDDAISWNVYSDDDGVFDAIFDVLKYFLPKKITACDNPTKQPSGFRFKKKPQVGVRYRFWCTWAYPQEEKRKVTQLLTIDIDRKSAQLAWKEAGLPRPFLVITNRVSGKCQMIWLLDTWFKWGEYEKLHSIFCKKLKADPSRPMLSRAPLLNQGRRSDVFYKSTLQAPNAILTVYVPEIYNPNDLIRTYKEADLSDIDWQQETPVSRVFIPKEFKSSQGPAPGNRNNWMIFESEATKEAMRTYDRPDRSDEENIAAMAPVFKKYFPGMTDAAAKAQARQALKLCKQNFDPSKRKHSYDHSSDVQRRRSCKRWDYEFQINGESTSAGAKRLGIASIDDFRNLVSSGYIIKRNLFWEWIDGETQVTFMWSRFDNSVDERGRTR
jgi:Replicase family